MLIRYKVILWFVILTGLLLGLFSIYIHFAFANSRELAFRERIKNKALATKEIYDQHDKVAEKIITSIPEQSEYVFDENNRMVFAINDLHDFKFDESFLNLVAKQKEFYFKYTRTGGQRKEGYAFSFGRPDHPRIIIITAFDKVGHEQVKSLGLILIFGNIFFLILIALAGFLFARNVLKSVNELAGQVEKIQANNLSFRLGYTNPKDEIGIVAHAFNKVLGRVQSLVDSQKSFISYASHELRTPLAAISGILETAIQYDKDILTAGKSMEMAHKESQRATSLINGLLQLANIESTDGKPEMQNLNIIDLLIDTLSAFKQENPTQEFSFNISEKVENRYIELTGNPQLLRTAFYNLIDNASKYSSMKKINISVLIISGSGVLFQIVDQGIGIQEEDKKQVLGPLFRGKNTTGIEGFGLGLALTHRIILLHKGEITLKKNADVGTTVEVFLPAKVINSL